MDKIIKFAKWTALTAGILLLVELLCGALRKYYYSSPRDFNKAEYLVRHADEDIIFLGNSAAGYHIDAQRLSDSLQTSCFNGGNSGSSVKFNLAVLKLILERHSPKMVILGLNAPDFIEIKEDASFELLKPLYGLHSPLFDSIMDSTYPREHILFKSDIWLMNPNFLPLAAYKLTTLNPTFLENKGYTELWEEPVAKVEWDDWPAIPGYVSTPLKEFRETCRKAGIPFALMISPDYVFSPAKHRLKEDLTALLQPDGSCMLWFDADHPEFKASAENFCDNTHMSGKGARGYTDTIARRIRNYMSGTYQTSIASQ